MFFFIDSLKSRQSMEIFFVLLIVLKSKILSTDDAVNLGFPGVAPPDSVEPENDILFMT